jgi:hypothetical protein
MYGSWEARSQATATQLRRSILLISHHYLLQFTINPEAGLESITFTYCHISFTEITLDPRLAHEKPRDVGFV